MQDQVEHSQEPPRKKVFSLAQGRAIPRPVNSHAAPIVHRIRVRKKPANQPRPDAKIQIKQEPDSDAMEAVAIESHLGKRSSSSQRQSTTFVLQEPSSNKRQKLSQSRSTLLQQSNPLELQSSVQQWLRRSQPYLSPTVPSPSPPPSPPPALPSQASQPTRSIYNNVSTEDRIRQYFGKDADSMLQRAESMVPIKRESPDQENLGQNIRSPIAPRQGKPLTVPHTPEFMRRSQMRANSKAARVPESPKSALRRRKSVDIFSARKQVLARNHTAPLPRPKLTSPKPFQFETDKRNPIFKHKLDDWEDRARKGSPLPGTLPIAVATSTPAPEPKRYRRSVQNELDIMHRRLTLSASTSDPMTDFANDIKERAKKRRSFEEAMQERQALQAQLRKEKDEQEAKKAREHLRHLRASLRHVPAPRIKDSIVRIKPSDAPLTVPKSPRFRAKPALR